MSEPLEISFNQSTQHSTSATDGKKSLTVLAGESSVKKQSMTSSHS